MIDTITNTELTDSQKEYLEYTVTGIVEKVFLGAKSIKNVNVKVSFKDIDDAIKLPSEAQPVELKLSFDVIQADENAVKDTLDETDNG